MKTFLFYSLMVQILVLTAAVSFASHEITDWRHNHSAAISITFDDGYWSQPSVALNVLSPRNMRGTLFLMTDSLNWAGTSWSMWRTVASEGHEVAGHTLAHPYLSELPEDELIAELRDSQEEIDANIPGQSCLTLAYPYGDYDDHVIEITKQYYISARTVWSPDNLNYYPDSGYHPIDFYEVGGFSFGSNSFEKIVALLDLAEQRSAWFVPLIHDIDPENYPQRYEKFIQMLDELQRRNIWVETYGGVVRYMREKIESDLSVVSESGSEIVLDLTHSLDPTIYDAPLTIRSTVPNTWSRVGINQGDFDTMLPTTVEGGETVVYFDAVPNNGRITLFPDSLPTYPVISIDPTLLSSSCGLGTNAPSQTFDIWNSGSDTLTYQISVDSSWLHCDIETGTSTGGKDSIMVIYETADLAPGTYSATITISDPNAGNSPVELRVHLTVSSTDSILDLNFEEGGGSIAFDASGNANDGMLTGATHTEDSAKGTYALNFDGVDDRVVVSYDDSLKPSNISVALWIKQLSSADNANYQGVIRGAYGDGYSAGFRILVNQGRPLFQINFGDNGPEWIWGATFPQDEWTHLAWTYDHQNIIIYQNGEPIAEIPETRDIQWSTYDADLYLGFAQWYYSGLIDDVMIFDDALSPDQIHGLYSPPIEEPVIAADPTSLNNQANIGVTPQNQTIGIWNNGDGALDYTISSDVDWINLDPETGTSSGGMNIVSVNYESRLLPAGTHSGNITIVDENASNSPFSISVQLTVNTPPAADNESVSTVEDTPIDMVLSASDADGDILTFTVTTAPQNGTLTGTAPALTYTPSTGFVGEDTFTFTVDDGNGGSATGTVTITVTATNTPPVADDVTVTTLEDTPVDITLTASDADEDPLTFSVADPPMNGALTGTVPELTYTPITGFVGDDSFTFEVDDGKGGNAIGTVSIIINTPDMLPDLELGFEEGIGETAYDTSGNAIDGVIAGPVYTDDSAVGAYALVFDGTDDRVTCPYQPDLKPETISVSFWVKHTVDTGSSYGGIIQGAYGNGYHNGFRIVDYKNQPLLQINFGDSAPTWILGGTFAQNEWTHIAFTYNHETIDLYQNGLLVSSTPETRNINWATAGDDLLIGFSQWYFQGGIDDLRIFDTALTPEQIVQLHEGTYQ